jgi:SAM-dependent methyltransferase
MQDRVAERAFYDELFANKPENEHITEGYDELHALAFPVAPTGPVVDIGCGTGAHAIRMARRGYQVIAVDLTVGGVRSARERFRREARSGLFFVGDAENLPLRDRSVSVAWTSLLLHHFPTLDKLPLELARITRDRLIAFEPNAHNTLTWVAFNVVNRLVGIEGMTRNQVALRPAALTRLFAGFGFVKPTVHFVDRPWKDGMSAVRRLYATATGFLPLKYRANKFLISFEKRAG